MKASTPIFKILSAVMLAAVVIYFTVQAYRYFSDPINTTLVYATTEETVLEVNGYLIRDEETFHSDAGTLAHTLSEGERVGKGQTLAMAYSDSGALTRVERLEALKQRQEQLTFSLVSYLEPDAALKHKNFIRYEESNHWRIDCHCSSRLYIGLHDHHIERKILRSRCAGRSDRHHSWSH